MPLSREQVEHVARLARLNLTPEEIEQYTHDLTSILAYIDQLATVNTEGVEPKEQFILAENVFREDEPRPSLSQAEALKNAPRKENGYFVVPKVIG